jgi:hypothetical protein
MEKEERKVVGIVGRGGKDFPIHELIELAKANNIDEKEILEGKEMSFSMKSEPINPDTGVRLSRTEKRKLQRKRAKELKKQEGEK